MEKFEIVEKIKKSKIVTEWHWYGYNFGFGEIENYTRFANALVEALLIIDGKIEGYALRIIGKLESYSGKKKDEDHYQQLFQICAEIYVLKQAVQYFSDCSNVKFEDEPRSKNSKKNPEFTIVIDGTTYGIEVKLPSLNDHMRKRTQKPVQITGRNSGLLDSFGIDNVVLPIDNKIKSFLESADKKFEGFKIESEHFVSILFILWDDYIYEPISALNTKPHGLLLEDTFAFEDGKPLRFENVDYIVIDRPLTNFVEDAAERKLIDNKSNCFDYGRLDEFPFKVYFHNPYSKSGLLTPKIIDCFQLKEYSMFLGAEYCPTDMVMWF